MGAPLPPLPAPRADRIGRLLGICCAAHCALVPIGLAVVAAVGAGEGWIGGLEWLEGLEQWLVLGAVAAAAASLWGHRRCGNRWMRAAWFAVGLTLLVVLRPAADGYGVPEWLVGVLAGAALVVAHTRRGATCAPPTPAR